MVGLRLRIIVLLAYHTLIHISVLLANIDHAPINTLIIHANTDVLPCRPDPCMSLLCLTSPHLPAFNSSGIALARCMPSRGCTRPMVMLNRIREDDTGCALPWDPSVLTSSSAFVSCIASYDTMPLHLTAVGSVAEEHHK